MYAFGDMTHSCMFTFGCAFRSVCLQAESGQMACHIPGCGMAGVHSEIVLFCYVCQCPLVLQTNSVLSSLYDFRWGIVVAESSISCQDNYR